MITLNFPISINEKYYKSPFFIHCTPFAQLVIRRAYLECRQVSLVIPVTSEYRCVAKKQKAITGAVMGINHTTNNATLTNPIAVADFVWLLIRWGMGKGESMEMEFNSIAAINNGSGENSKYSAVRIANSR